MNKSVALITGASRGIGCASAIQLAKDGFEVVINYHTGHDAAKRVRDLIIDGGGHATLRPFDVANHDEVEEAVKELTMSVGPIRVLVNNAAIIRDELLMQMPVSAWHQVINTDLNGVFYCTKATVRFMAGNRHLRKRIINITSIAAEMGNVGQTNYCAAKAGVIGFTKALARELAPMGITVNAVSPGVIDTTAISHLSLDNIVRTIPLRRIGSPEEVAHAVSFLASEQASYITGQVLRVDGGLLM
jgi:3-oxoacyl-[acyl-carrier protein] reductase